MPNMPKTAPKERRVSMIAAILIVKDDEKEFAHLYTCLDSIMAHVDGIYLNINGENPTVPKELEEKLKPIPHGIITTTWNNNFAEARNANLAQVPEEFDWVIWLDTDDTVRHPEKIREVAEESKGYDCIYVDYEYDHDDHGNVTTTHMVGRLFKNNGSHHWNPKTRIHETLSETRSVSQGMTKDFTVVHHADGERTQESFQRNITMLEDQLKAEREAPDPRTFYYLASTYMDAGYLDDSLHMFNKYLELSGWDQERSVALTKMGRIYSEKGDNTEARKMFAWAHGEDPHNPEPRVELASLEVAQGQWQKAIQWLTEVEKLDTHQTTLETNPLTTTFRTYMLLAESYLNCGGEKIELAEKYAKKALKYKKNNPDVKQFAETIINVNRDRKELRTALEKYKKTLKKDRQAAKQILDNLPERLADNILVAKLKQSFETFTWPEKSIAIMTGDTALDFWGPWSLSDGIGGSEEAIIRLAPKLAQKGYKVVVFAKPGERAGVYDGVQWRNFWDCNLDDEFDVFIGWRGPFIFDRKIKARKKYLWLHDVMEVGEFTEERLNNLDKVILLSEYHKSLFPIPDDKVLLSGNGIDPEEFNITAERDPHRIFYGSSHVRGLSYLYEVWPDVIKEVPDATLHVFYGRESYDKINKGNPERLKWMDDMIQTAKDLPGVTDHGKVGQDRLVQEMFQSGIWAYPCPFPEVFCITSVKAQAAGCTPVTTSFAALDEMVQFGTKLDIPNDGNVGRADQAFLDNYKNALITALKNPQENREEMMQWARQKSWQHIADQWVGDFEDEN